MWSRVASDHGLPMNWSPMGRPSLSCPTVTVMAGNPRKFPAMEYRISAAFD
jgi:hypothetical protein